MTDERRVGKETRVSIVLVSLCSTHNSLCIRAWAEYKEKIELVRLALRGEKEALVCRLLMAPLHKRCTSTRERTVKGKEHASLMNKIKFLFGGPAVPTLFYIWKEWLRSSHRTQTCALRAKIIWVEYSLSVAFRCVYPKGHVAPG